jgi:hypothetical protein
LRETEKKNNNDDLKPNITSKWIQTIILTWNKE